MGELGTEKRILFMFKKYPGEPDKELTKKSGVSKGTFYRYKKILQGKGLI
jgi:transposase